MPQSTLREAITQVARNCSLVDGQSMTPYSDDTVLAKIIAAHELIKSEHEWSEMVLWYQRVLDGTVGLVTQLLPVRDWKQIRRVYHEAYRTPLPLLSSYINPTTSTLMNGYRGLAPSEDNTTDAGRYLVQFYPPTWTGTVLFEINNVVDFTDDTTVLPIDWWLHVYYATWMYAQDDGTNQGQIDMYMQLAQKRMRQVTALENSRPSFQQPNQLIPNDWWESDAPYS